MPKRRKKQGRTATWNTKRRMWERWVQADNVKKCFRCADPTHRGQEIADANAEEWRKNHVVNGATKIETLCALYVENLQALKRSQDHIRKEESICRNWIVPTIGTRPAGKLTEVDLEKPLLAAAAAGRKKSYLIGIRNTMNNVLKRARKHKATALKPDDPIPMPTAAPSEEREPIQPRELYILMTCSGTTDRGRKVLDYCVNAYRLDVCSSLRPGEVLRIPRHGYDQGGRLVVNGTKTINARRAPVINAYMRAIIDAQLDFLAATGIESDYLFCMPDGRPITTDTYNKRWRKYRTVNGITTNTPPYGLRHTFASICQPYVPEQRIKSVMGHSAKMPTYSVYGHEIDGEDDVTAAMTTHAFDRALEPFGLNAQKLHQQLHQQLENA